MRNKATDRPDRRDGEVSIGLRHGHNCVTSVHAYRPTTRLRIIIMLPKNNYRLYIEFSLYIDRKENQKLGKAVMQREYKEIKSKKIKTITYFQGVLALCWLYLEKEMTILVYWLQSKEGARYYIHIVLTGRPWWIVAKRLSWALAARISLDAEANARGRGQMDQFTTEHTSYIDNHTGIWIHYHQIGQHTIPIDSVNSFVNKTNATQRASSSKAAHYTIHVNNVCAKRKSNEIKVTGVACAKETRRAARIRKR